MSDNSDAKRDEILGYADDILGRPGELGLAEVPGNEIPAAAYNLACAVQEWFRVSDNSGS